MTPEGLLDRLRLPDASLEDIESANVHLQLWEIIGTPVDMVELSARLMENIRRHLRNKVRAQLERDGG